MKKVKCETKLLKRFLVKKKNRVVLNIIAIAMMLTGPILMILPGPQIISWVGLALFIYANYDLLLKYKWFRKIVLNLKIILIKRKLRNREWVYFKEK